MLLKHWVAHGGNVPVVAPSRYSPYQLTQMELAIPQHVDQNVHIRNCGFDKLYKLIQIEGVGHVSVSLDTHIAGALLAEMLYHEGETENAADKYDVGDYILVRDPDGKDTLRRIRRVAVGTRSDCYAYKITTTLHEPPFVQIKLRNGGIFVLPEVHNDLRTSKQ